MKKAVVDHITLQETVPINDLESLIRGYVVGYQRLCEAKSGKVDRDF